MFDQIFPSLEANVVHWKGYQSHAETSRKLLLFEVGNEFESYQKKQHCNNFREFFIRIRYPVIKFRVFLHFSPIPHSPTNLHCHFLQRYIYTVWIFFMWTTHLAIKKEERNGYGSGTSLWNKLHIQVSLWFYYTCRLLCSRNILREFILWIGVFAFCFILFHCFLSFQQKW